MQCEIQPACDSEDLIKCCHFCGIIELHLDKKNTYIRMLFIDYSSAFNTIIPIKLITKLNA